MVVKEEGGQDFYLTILNALKIKTNLKKIQENLKISKQKLNYYIRQLKNRGLITKKGKGWYEVSKNITKYGSNFPKDFIRGHGYVWETKLSKIPEGWDKRIDKLTQKGIHFKLVGAKLDIPRIKVLGRKVWLCKDHLRIFEGNMSYYGENAIESKKRAFQGILEVIYGLENKLGIKLDISKLECKKEHYALIKNDLAIDCNKKGVILRISDETGEWLLVDDSLEKGGELETIGKKALVTNIEMQKWWNEHKETKFEITPKFIMEGFNKMMAIQIETNKQLLEYKEQNKQHLKLIKEYRAENKRWRKQFNLIKDDKNKDIRRWL